MSSAWSRVTIRLRWVGFIALLATIVGGLLMVPTTIRSLAPGGFEVRGGQVARTEAALVERFDTAQVDLVVLVTDHQGASLTRDGDARTRLDATIGKLRGMPEVARVLGPRELATARSLDGREALLLISLHGDDRAKQDAFAEVEQAVRAGGPRALGGVRTGEQVRAGEGLDVAIGGPLAADVEAQALARADLQRAELVALPIALLILLIYFRRPLPALLPISIGAFAITGTFPLLRMVAAWTELSLFALNIVVFLGLGLAVDYSLFIVQRQREELAVGNSVAVALERTLASAGKTVLFSGVAVMVSLLALAWVPISLLRSIALGGSLVVALANVGALVILPALLALLGKRVAGVGLWGGGEIEPRLLDDQVRRSMWSNLAAAVMRRPGLVAGSVAVALLLTGVPLLRMQTAPADARIFPHESEIHRVHARISDAGRFAVDPSATHLLLVRTRAGEPILSSDPLVAVFEYAERIAEIPGVVAVDGLPSMPLPVNLMSLAQAPPGSIPGLDQLVDRDATLLRVSSSLTSASPAAREQLAAIEAAVPAELRVSLAGSAAAARELDRALRQRLPWAALTVALASFVVLVLAFGAPVVALKAVLMTALSLVASFGALVWVFQDGRFEQLLGYRSIGTVDPTVPVMMFALVFGLSMDYELFLLSRIREAWLRGADRAGADRAGEGSVVEGLTRSGAIITTAALILIAVVLGLALGTLVFMKQLGIGMALAIFIDASLIRILLVPATMALLGDWNWWTPRWIARTRELLRLELREGEAVRA